MMPLKLAYIYNDQRERVHEPHWQHFLIPLLQFPSLAVQTIISRCKYYRAILKNPARTSPEYLSFRLAHSRFGMASTR